MTYLVFYRYVVLLKDIYSQDKQVVMSLVVLVCPLMDIKWCKQIVLQKESNVIFG